MYKLSTTDAAFLHLETSRTPMHIASVQILELPTGTTEDAFIESLKTFLLARIEQVPYLTNRLQSSPLGIDQPVWVRTEDFDINRHVYGVQVPSPGGQSELEETVAHLHEQRLDRAQPLWECVVLRGLADGRIAYYNCIHHACIDGVAGQAATQLLMDVSPEPEQREFTSTPEANHLGDYSASEMWRSALENFTNSAVQTVASALDMVTVSSRLAQRALHPDKGYGATFERAPSTRFNRPVSAQRNYAAGELPLADLKAIAKGNQCTINDVFLSLCGGALRRYFERRQENPRAPLLAGCPVSLPREAGSARSNAVSMMKVSLGTHLADDCERLTHVRASCQAAKGVLADASELLGQDLSAPGLPLLQRAMTGVQEQFGLSELLEPAVNLVVSNIPGPRRTLYSNGARMLSHYPVSIPAHGMGVNITVQSYVDGLFFGVTACAKALPDADQLRDDLLAAFTDLCAALPASVLAFDRKASVVEPDEHSSSANDQESDEDLRVA